MISETDQLQIDRHNYEAKQFWGYPTTPAGVRLRLVDDLPPGQVEMGYWKSTDFGWPEDEWDWRKVTGLVAGLDEVSVYLAGGRRVRFPRGQRVLARPVPAEQAPRAPLSGASAQTTIAYKDEEIARLGRQLASAEHLLLQRKKTIDDLEGRVLDLNLQVHARREDVAIAQGKLDELRAQRDAAFTDRDKANARLNEYLRAITEDGSRREDARRAFRDIMEEPGEYLAPMSTRQQNRQVRALTAALGHMSKPVIPADVVEYLRHRVARANGFPDESQKLVEKYLTPETPPEPEPPKWRKGDIVRATRDRNSAPLGTLFLLEREPALGRADWLQLDPHRAYRLVTFVERCGPELIVRDGLPVAES